MKDMAFPNFASKTVLFTLMLAVLTLHVLADTQTATVDFTAVQKTNNPLAFSMDESEYGGTHTITSDTTQQANIAKLGVPMMRISLGYSTPGNPNSTIIALASGAPTNITGDQWIGAIKAAGAMPEIRVAMDINSEAYWTIDASNMVKYFNVTTTSNRADRWIIGNEPNGNGVNVTNYSTNFITMYQAMKAVDSTIKIGGPVPSYYSHAYIGTFLRYTTNRADFIDFHQYAAGQNDSQTDAQILANTLSYETNINDLRTNYMIPYMGAARAAQVDVEVGEWNENWSPDSRQLENYNSVWAASAVGHMIKAGAIVREYADKDGALGAMLDQANLNTTWPNNVTYNGNTDDPMPIYHGIGMFTGENRFQHFGSYLVKSTASTTNIEVFASANPENIVAINKTPGTTSSVTFTLTGLSSGTLAVWQKNSGGNLGNYGTNVPVKLGTVNVSSGSFTYSLAPYTVTTFVYTNSQVAAPSFNPAGGTYGSAQSVTISTTTGGATIRYTTDGSTPSETQGTVYSSPVNISVTTTLKAIAYESGMTDSSVATGTYTISGGGGSSSLWLNFNTANQYNTNFNNPGSGGSPCTETNAGGVTNSGALLVTGGDGNATYANASWNFSTNNAAISVSMMIKIKQATGTGNKIQLGLVNSNSAGFAFAASGWNFGSFRLLPQSTSALTYQLGYQTATNGTTSSGNVGSVITLTSGHWYQFATYFTNTGPGTSYNLACSLIDYGTDGATQGTNMFTFSTLETAAGTQAVLSSDATVWPSFRVANDTGVSQVDDFAVNNSGSGNQPKVIGVPPAGQAAPQFGAPALAKGQLMLTWSSGGATAKTPQAGTVILLTATSLAGPWTVVTNATSPYTIPVDANTPQQFFRLEQ